MFNINSQGGEPATIANLLRPVARCCAPRCYALRCCAAPTVSRESMCSTSTPGGEPATIADLLIPTATLSIIMDWFLDGSACAPFVSACVFCGGWWRIAHGRCWMRYVGFWSQNSCAECQGATT